jgi:pimeloyl-ACP methyl ester carboxylesterase
MVKMSAIWYRRMLLSAAILYLVLSYGRTQTQAVAPQPLGRLVDVGGYRVHVYCVGTGSPTVVITGAGYSFDWGLVQPEVAKFTRVCTHDHSGVAWSDPGPTDTCSLRVGEIHAALRNAKVEGPYVLVGHSLGALVARLYAGKYPNEVAGMVIVDHAFFIQHLVAVPPSVSMRTGNLPLGASPITGGAPPEPIVSSANNDLDFQKLPAPDYQLHLWGDSLPGHPKTMARNSAMVPECFSDVETASRNQASPLGDMPLIVLSQSHSFGGEYAELQSRLLSLSSNSKQVIAENSGHFIMIDRPEVVITAIREVVEAAQNYTKLRN